MYEIVMYEDARGKCPVEELINRLDQTNQKAALKKIYYHLERVEQHGTRTGKPSTKPLRNGIWEIRPGQYRILFGQEKNKIVLLSWFHKKSRTTPPREIHKAIRRFKDWKSRN